MWFVKLLSSISKNSSGFKGELVSGHNFYGVWGLGRSGKAAYEYLEKKMKISFSLINALWMSGRMITPPKVQCFQQDDPQLLNLISEINRIILSPGIPREHKVVKSFIDAGVPVINEIELAYEELKDQSCTLLLALMEKPQQSASLERLLKIQGKRFLSVEISEPLYVNPCYPMKILIFMYWSFLASKSNHFETFSPEFLPY